MSTIFAKTENNRKISEKILKTYCNCEKSVI